MCEYKNRKCVTCEMPQKRDIRFGVDFAKDKTVAIIAEMKDGVMIIRDMVVLDNV